MKCLKIMEYFHYLNGGDCFRVFMYVKTHLIVHLKYMNCILCKLPINKALKTMLSESESVHCQFCLIFSNLMDCRPPGSSVHGFLWQEYWSGLQFPPS